MSLTAELVLPEDVVVVPVADLDPALRTELGETDGFAITRPQGRAASSFIGAEVAELLGEFRSPTTVVAAVLRYSRRHELDPHETLDQAYPALRQCLGDGYLVPPGAAAAGPIDASLTPGDVFAGATVERCVRVLDDTEVYRCTLPDGSAVALKLARGAGEAVAASVRGAFVREAAVLAVLDGPPAPRLMRDGSDADRPHLLLEWCAGVPAQGAGRADPAAAWLAVLAAYEQLHERGVMHGDIHPGNILIDSVGAVRVLDFALAGAPSVPGAVPRGGLQQYFEPEFADAVRGRRRPPAVSAASEVFGLGALGYELITGVPWMDLGLDHDEALTRIVERGPTSFRERRVHGRDHLEQVVRSALAKNPADRPASVTALAALAGEALIRDETGSRTARGVTGRADRHRRIDELIEDVLPGGRLSAGALRPPTASLSHGAAGIAAGLLRIASLRADPELLAVADQWAERADRLSVDPDAFDVDDPDFDDVVIAPGTPFHRRSGVDLVRALVANAMGHAAARQQAVDGFVAAASSGAFVLDGTLGTGGVLMGAALLAEALQGDPYGDTTSLLALGDSVATQLAEALAAAGPIATSRDLPALGVAHGWAGLLLAALRWSDASGEAPAGWVVDRLDELAALGRPSPAGLQWPWTNEAGGAGRVTVPGWCNGTAGHVMLWLQAHRSLGDDRFSRMAERAGAHLAATAAGPPQLCCGPPGQAYAMLDLHHTTGDPTHLAAAIRMAELAVADLDGGPHPDLIAQSLVRGPLGAAVLLSELDQPGNAAMPAFGLEGW